MAIEYDVSISMNISKLDPTLDELMSNLSKHFVELTDEQTSKVSLRNTVFTISMTSEKDLTKDDKSKISKLLEKTYNEKVPGYDFKVDFIRRKQIKGKRY